MHAEKQVCEQATGCRGSGSFRQWAEEQGYPHCEVLDWTSSAGDWSFLVSQDGEEWFVMCQTNNWPRPGFTREIDESRSFYGTAEEAAEEVWQLFR